VDGSGTRLHNTHEAFGDSTHLVSTSTEIGDGEPLQDVCSNNTIDQVTMGRHLLNAKGITWGSFMGGFDLTAVNANGTSGCGRTSTTTASGTSQSTSADYIPHHAWFPYYASTRNATHARPSSVIV
jgi:phospholipase C